MRINSPIGNLPFEPRRLRVAQGHLLLDGSLGAWPTTVQIGLSDIQSIIRILRYPLLALAIIFMVIVAKLNRHSV